MQIGTFGKFESAKECHAFLWPYFSIAVAVVNGFLLYRMKVRTILIGGCFNFGCLQRNKKCPQHARTSQPFQTSEPIQSRMARNDIEIPQRRVVRERYSVINPVLTGANIFSDIVQRNPGSPRSSPSFDEQFGQTATVRHYRIHSGSALSQFNGPANSAATVSTQLCFDIFGGVRASHHEPFWARRISILLRIQACLCMEVVPYRLLQLYHGQLG